MQKNFQKLRYAFDGRILLLYDFYMSTAPLAVREIEAYDFIFLV